MLHKCTTSQSLLKAKRKHPDQASIQGAKLDLPNSSWTVPKLKAWLDQEGIAYDSGDLKADLLRKAGVNDV